MITYEQARDKAKQIIPKVDIYYEYPDAYMFTNSKAKGEELWDNDVVIYKANGEITNISGYIMESKFEIKEVQAKLVI